MSCEVIIEAGPLLNMPVLNLRLGYVFPNKYGHLQVVYLTHKISFTKFIQVQIYLRN